MFLLSLKLGIPQRDNHDCTYARPEVKVDVDTLLSDEVVKAIKMEPEISVDERISRRLAAILIALATYTYNAPSASCPLSTNLHSLSQYR